MNSRRPFYAEENMAKNKIYWRKDLTGPLAQVFQQMEQTAKNLGRSWQISRANCFYITVDEEHKTLSIQLERRFIDGGKYTIGRPIWVRNKAAYSIVAEAGFIKVITDLEAM